MTINYGTLTDVTSGPARVTDSTVTFQLQSRACRTVRDKQAYCAKRTSSLAAHETQNDRACTTCCQKWHVQHLIACSHMLQQAFTNDKASRRACACLHQLPTQKNHSSLAGACRKIIPCHAGAAELAWHWPKHNPATTVVWELPI
jgi:hypothetical protein